MSSIIEQSGPNIIKKCGALGGIEPRTLTTYTLLWSKKLQLSYATQQNNSTFRF